MRIVRVPDHRVHPVEPRSTRSVCDSTAARISSAGPERPIRGPLTPRLHATTTAGVLPGMLGAALCVGAVGMARAQDAAAPAPLETITVTGSRLGSATSVETTTFDRATINVRDKPSVPILLADAVGAQTTLPGGRGSVGELVIRGAEPNFSSVLVDGVQMNDPTNTRGGSFDFATLTLDEIERVEVLNGPLSSIYGSDALGGVINIITRTPADRLAVSGLAAVGGEDYARYAGRVSGPVTARTAYSVNAASLRDGHSDAPASARVTSLNGAFELRGRDERSGLSLRARRSDASFVAFPDSSGGPELAVIRVPGSREATDTTVGGTWRTLLSGRHRLNINASAFDHDESVDSPGVAPGPGGAIPPNRSRTAFSRRIVTAFVRSRYAETIETAMGLSLEQQSGRSSGTLELTPGAALPTTYALDRDNAAVFAELGLPVADNLRLEAALRVDDSDVAARATTHRLNLTYHPGTGRTQWHLTAAEAYKLPSLFALGDPLTGNAALRPETAESIEIGVDIGDAADTRSLGVALFSQRFSDLIDFDFDTFQNVNRDRVETDGIEWHGRWRLDDRLTLTGNATWLDIDVVGSDVGLRQRPERYGSIGARWAPTAALSVYAGLRYVGTRLDESIPTGERSLPSYTRMDVAVRWRLGPTLALGLAVDDLGDRRYQDAIGFPGLGRRVRLSVQADLAAP